MMSIILLDILLCAFANVFDAFDDTIPYDIVWGDPKTDLNQRKEMITMISTDSEEYVCQLPLAYHPGNEEELKPVISAKGIIGKLENDKICSYRVDSYWIYEVCHGRHIKQFHEERDVNNKKVLIKQEFFLGYIGYDSYPQFDASNTEQIPTMNHAGALRPYYSIVYKSGTECDLLPGTKRKTVVIYICMPDFQTSVVSVKETSTCEYEIIIYLSLLCKNVLYKVKEDPINHIYCLSKDGIKWKSPIGYGRIDSNNLKTLFSELPPHHEHNKVYTHPKSQKNVPSEEPKKSQLTFPEKEFVKQFLTGEKCVIGGTGWWKYEFCYMRSVKQFHQERHGKRIEVLLGMWDENVHIQHIKTKTIQVSSVSSYTNLYYFSGDICDETGLPRQVQVRLRCSNHNNVQALTMFMEEPSTCSYKFTAESVLFCKVIEHTDEHGIPQILVDDVIDQI